MTTTLKSSLNNSKISFVAGRACPLPGNDIDTDRIIPARFMKCVTFDDLGQYAFYDVRFNEDGSPKEHVLNSAQYKGFSILLVGRNFGCGSSREHAPQSLSRYGIRAILGLSFAEIFADNCTAIGLPVAIVDESTLSALTKHVETDPQKELSLDFQQGTATFLNHTYRIQQPDQTRKALTEGTWDTTAELISAEDQIQAVAHALPYTRGYT